MVVSAIVAMLGLGFGLDAQSPAPGSAASKEWPTYGHDPGGMRFSPLTQITPANVGQLKVAWVYHMKPAAPARRAAHPLRSCRCAVGDAPAAAAQGRGGAGAAARGFSSSEVTPLVVNGMMYLATPYSRVVALDADTGKEIWAFQLPSANPSTRGVEYWPGDAQTPAQIVFGSSDGKLYSLDAKTGKPNDAFGDKRRRRSEHAGDPAGPARPQRPELAADRLQEPGHHRRHARRRIRRKGPAGDVRAWDMHTGKLVWTFRSIPRAGEKYNDTWAGDSWKNRSGVNVWGFITVDAQRGIVYMPFGAPSVDQYGGDRAGDNLFGTSLVAADANTGKYLWHFQVVHHDIWDADMTGAPALDRREAGRPDDSRRRGRSTRSGCCSCSIA